MPSLRPTNPSCRFQSTQTSRRRVPYTIGAEDLDAETPRVSLDHTEEQNLTADIKRLYDDLLPTATSEENRTKVAKKLRAIMREEWPTKHIEVSIFGSSGNLLYTSKSDVDICIIVHSLETVCALADLLARRGMRNVTCVHAKSVPIVKVWDPELEVACDLNVNNLIALKNTSMVKAYMEIDDRVRPLAMIVKYWTRQRVINEASGGTLSSYTWTLLLINFLQTRPMPILPVFALRDSRGQAMADFTDELQRHHDFGKPNDESIGQLLFQFFRRYGYEMEYETAVVSVRTGATLTKKEKNWHRATNNRLCVEEPFNTERNLANTADDTAFRGLHLELRRAFEMISNAKDLVSSVCEQFKFPVEEPRTIFERPPPQPRPILSRSTSQSGRGGRGGSRGNRRGHDSRSTPNARRSSSAAAFDHAMVPNMQSPQLGYAMPEFMVQPGRPVNELSPEELSRFSHRISIDQQQLRNRQLQLAQSLFSMPHNYNSALGHGTSASLQRPTRQLYSNAYPNSRLTSLDIAPPGSAPLYQPFPYGPSFESPVTMSHSSSNQGTSTNPGSPMLTPSTPHRRTLQRAPQVTSPGNNARSHSQPARPLGPQLPISANSGPHFPQMPMSQVSSNPGGPAYVGPYIGPFGGYYIAMPTADSLPREYLGYGIGGHPQSASASRAQTPAQVPVYDHALQQSQHLLPTRNGRTSSMASSVAEPPRSPSPLAVLSDYRDPQPALSNTNASQIYRSDLPIENRMSDDSAPMIVNGSNVATVRPVPGHEGRPLEDRRGSDWTNAYPFGPELTAAQPSLQRSPQSFAARVGASLAQQEQRRHEIQRPNFLNAEELDEPIALLNGSLASTHLPHATTTAFPTLDMPPPSRPSDPRASPNGSATDASIDVRRTIGGSRPSIPSLDLGAASSTDRISEARPSASLLSPVQETRTPSPTSNRKQGHIQRNSVQLNGTNGTNSNGLRNDTAQPPAPPTFSRAHEKENGGTNGSASSPTHTRQLSPANSAGQGPSKPPPQQQQQGNAWQQAGRGKKGKKKGDAGSGDGAERKGGGQTMPDNVAERKGG